MTRQLDHDERTLLLRAAIAAPSLHNTQPWKFTFVGRAVNLFRDPTRELPEEDLDLRGSHLSAGAALFNLRVAAAQLGYHSQVTLLPDEANPTWVARAELGRTSSPESRTADDERLYAAISRRFTNRRPFTDRQIPDDVRDALVEAARIEGARMEWVTRPERARKLLELTADATLEDHHSPARVRERARWIGTDRVGDGIPVEALGVQAIQYASPVRDFLAGSPERGLAFTTYEARPQLAVIWSDRDGPEDWLRAGQALERALLEATARGVDASFLDQPLEYRDLRELVRDPRLGWGRPQAILRFGYSDNTTPLARTPRRDPREFLCR